jgi:hypothetical protein
MGRGDSGGLTSDRGREGEDGGDDGCGTHFGWIKASKKTGSNGYGGYLEE